VGLLRLPLGAPPILPSFVALYWGSSPSRRTPGSFLFPYFLVPPHLPSSPLRSRFAVDSRANRISSWLNYCRIPIYCMNRVAADTRLAVPRTVWRLVVLSGLIYDSRSFFHRQHVSRTYRTVILLGNAVIHSRAPSAHVERH
jgi:hypothetical protein